MRTRILSYVLLSTLLFANPAIAQDPTLPDWIRDMTNALSPQILVLDVQVRQLYQAGKYTEAIPIAQRALKLAEEKFGREHAEVGPRLNILATLYHAQGRYKEAEPLFQRNLEIQEKLRPTNPQELAKSLSNLVGVYSAQERYGDAEPLLKRALGLYKEALGSDHQRVGEVSNNLAAIYRSLGRFEEAESLYGQSLEIQEKAQPRNDRHIAKTMNNLAEVLRAQGRHSKAKPLYERSLQIKKRLLGPEHIDVGATLNNLGEYYSDLGHYSQAEERFSRSLAIHETALGAEHPAVAIGLNNLARLHFRQGNWRVAAEHWRRSSNIITTRVKIDTDSIGKALTGKSQSEAVRSSKHFWGLVKAEHRLGVDIQSTSKMFQTAQWALGSTAAEALSKMAARGATGVPDLGQLVRERETLETEWQKRVQTRIAAVSQASGARDEQVEAVNVARIKAIEERIATFDKRLAAEFPDYAALANPEPSTVSDVQARLRSNEALMLFLDTAEWKPTPEETFIWVITKTLARWVRSSVGTQALTREVALLRCGLDAELWDASRYKEVEGSSASDLAQRAVNEQILFCSENLPEPEKRFIQGHHVELLQFDLARSHKLYRALFGEIEDLIKGKDLLIVPSGPLTQLPFQTLVTKQPDERLTGLDSMRKASWLARDHAITILPAVSSLIALREYATASQATKAFIGFGNPLLDGNGAYEKRKADARKINDCASASEVLKIKLKSVSMSAKPIKAYSPEDMVAQVREQIPLPESALVLCDVAKTKVPSQIHLGASATETKVKALSKNKTLADYKVVHFSTHGLLAGNLEGAREPGLILTPPQKGTNEDDGYLSASEVAGLKLDADWVVLSACNTAAGGAKNAEALSGLARAFFYAQTRSLLVSHWSVDSLATAKLISAAVGSTQGKGRAKALQSAMLAMIDNGARKYWAHPTYWAPFIIVGEGAPVN